MRKARFTDGSTRSSEINLLRAGTIYAFFLLMAVLVIVRLVRLQVIKHETLIRYARVQYEYTRDVPAQRGRILDSDGNCIAMTIPDFESVAVRPARTVPRGKWAGKLAAILPLTKQEILKKLNSGHEYVYLLRKVKLSDEQRKALIGLDSLAVDITREAKRVYPFHSFAAQVTGFVNMDNQGCSGIERIFDDLLKGVDGSEVYQYDAKKNRIHDPRYPSVAPINGSDIYLTIDMTIQQIAEEELAREVEATGATGGMVVITEPGTGRILSMFSYPAYDPNEFYLYPAKARKNRAVTDGFEPGSTLKLVPFARLVEDRLIQGDELVFCENGKFKVADTYIRDAHKYSWLTAANVLAKSSNIGTVKLSERISQRDLFTTLRDFGFAQKTGIPQTGEFAGMLKSPSDWWGTSQANISIGQGLLVTGLQLAMAYGAVADNGVLHKPQLVDHIVREGKVIFQAEPEKVRQAIRPATARALKSLLRKAVVSGTGKRAQIQNYQVVGKTGTAQMVDTENKTYFQDRYVASFVGFFPENDPVYLAAIILEDPKRNYYGGLSAAPMFKRIFERVLLYKPLREKSSSNFAQVVGSATLMPASRPSCPDFVGGSVDDAVTWLKAHRIGFNLEGSGRVVISQGVLPGNSLNNNQKFSLVTGKFPLPSSRVKIPNLRRKTLKQAIRELTALGLDCRIKGSGRVINQSPGAGTLVRAGETCTLTAKGEM